MAFGLEDERVGEAPSLEPSDRRYWKDLPMELIAQLPEVSALPHDLEPSVRAVLLRAATRREDDESRRASLLARARRFDPMGIVVPE